MSLDSDIFRLVKQLTWETVEGGVEWRLRDPPRSITAGTLDLIPIYIECRYEGRQTIGVYERRYRHYIDEDSYYWNAMIVLVLLDNEGRVIYESRESDILINNLFDVARDRASNLTGVLGALLKKP
ncbi:hypothetical protein [Stenotrophomonas rhizophila]|uniref:hypothetical protein n=1 Tax=Stenotrophomonas rhizophila TaxID=216778 RepID=UPI0010C09F0C|nr:hypothetical protein [Stenotrophomonas rhizophila]